MRMIATALEEYRLDRGSGPDLKNGLGTVGTLRAFLEPEYLKLGAFTANDGWGHPIRFWTDGTNLVLISFGADGKPEPGFSIDSLPKGIVPAELADPNADIVWADGAFLRRPVGITP